MQYDASSDVLTTEEVASLLRVHRETIRRYREDEGLPAHDLSPAGAARPSWRYLRTEVLDWLRSRCSDPAAARIVFAGLDLLHELDAREAVA